jgi:hypothetical protein
LPFAIFLAVAWYWGTIIAALILTSFLVSPVAASPRFHLCELLIALLILLSLSVIT